jgi:hypothetical protein
MNGEPVLYDSETDTLLIELRPWPAASPAEVNEQVGGEEVEEGLVVHYGPDGLPHAFEVEQHASRRKDGAELLSSMPGACDSSGRLFFTGGALAELGRPAGRHPAPLAGRADQERRRPEVYQPTRSARPRPRHARQPGQSQSGATRPIC